MNKIKSKTPSRLVIFVIDEFNKQMFGLPKDSRCPLEQDLADECGVSRTTVRKAYDLLNKQGLVYRKGSVRFLKDQVKTKTVEQKSPPISREEEVSKYLIGLIGKGEIVSGQKLSENRIAEIIGCSISPVREAFISLAPLGIFEKQSRHQWQVVNPDNKMFQELYEFRRILETYCLNSLMQESVLTKKTPKLNTLLKKTESLLEKEEIDFKSFFEIDVSLHLFLLEVPGNRFIMERSKFIYTIIDFQRSSRFYSMDRARLALNQHVDILKAIISSNKQEALSELEKHLSSSLETLKNINKAEAG